MRDFIIRSQPTDLNKILQYFPVSPMFLKKFHVRFLKRKFLISATIYSRFGDDAKTGAYDFVITNSKEVDQEDR